MPISKDVALSEITLRRYEKPSKLKERELVRKVCLSLGLLQPGDSRDVVVDVLHVLLKARKRKKLLSVEEIEQKVIQSRKLHRVAMLGVASSNIRRQIKRLRELFLVEKIKTRYRITEFLPLEQIFSSKTIPFLLDGTIERVREHLWSADAQFSASPRQEKQ